MGSRFSKAQGPWESKDRGRPAWAGARGSHESTLGNVLPCTASLGHAGCVQRVSLMCKSYNLHTEYKAVVLHTYWLADLSLFLSPSLFLSFSFSFPPSNVFFDVLNPGCTKCNCQVVGRELGRPQTVKSPEMDSSALVCIIHSRAGVRARIGCARYH